MSHLLLIIKIINYLIEVKSGPNFIRNLKMSQKHEFKVEMTCEGCSGAVKRVLGRLEGQGVNSFEVDLPNQKVYVDSSLPRLK